MIYIDIDTPAPAGLALEPLEIAARKTLELEQADPKAELTILLSDDSQLHALNRQFMQVDAPTDVLSFPAQEVDPETGVLYLGDIIISLERAQAQADAGGHALLAELQLLVVHGVLHLLGHDHAADDEKARMWQAQRSVLAGLGVGLAPN